MQPFVSLRLFGAGLSMDRKKPRHVIVHNVAEEHQEKHQSNLNEALLESQAEIAPPDSFQSEKQDVSTIQYWDRQKIQDPQIKADDGHQVDHGVRAFLHRLSCLVDDPHWSEQQLYRLLAGEEPANHS